MRYLPYVIYRRFHFFCFWLCASLFFVLYKLQLEICLLCRLWDGRHSSWCSDFVFFVFVSVIILGWVRRFHLFCFQFYASLFFVLCKLQLEYAYFVDYGVAAIVTFLGASAFVFFVSLGILFFILVLILG